MHVERLQNKINRRLFPRFISIRSVHNSTSLLLLLLRLSVIYYFIDNATLYTLLFHPRAITLYRSRSSGIEQWKKGFSCRLIVVCFGHLVFGCYSDKRASPNEQKKKRKKKLLQLQGRLLCLVGCAVRV